MGTIRNFNTTPLMVKTETIHINLKKRKAQGVIGAIKFIDKDTKQHIVYIPSLEISGYGETEAKAFEMIQFCIDDFFQLLIGMPAKKINEELAKYGWHKTMFNKDFSRAYVDSDGELKNFNAEADTVERITLTAA